MDILQERLEKKLDVNDTRMRHAVLKKIQEATPHKTAVVLLLTSHLKNHPSKTNKTCWRRKDELISNVLRWTTIHGHTSVGRLTRIYLNHLSADIRCNLENKPGGMNDRDEWRVRIRKTCADSAPCCSSCSCN